MLKPYTRWFYIGGAIASGLSTSMLSLKYESFALALTLIALSLAALIGAAKFASP